MWNLFTKKDSEPEDSNQSENNTKANTDSEPQTQHKKAEVVASARTPQPAAAKISRSHDRDLFQSLLAGLYDGIIIIDTRGCLIQTNQRARDFFGYTEADLWNINCTELIPQINTKVIFKIQENIGINRHTVVTATCKKQDGTQFQAEIAISRISMTSENDLVLSIRKSDRRIKAQVAHQVRNDILKNAGSGIIACTTEGAIEYANQAFTNLIAEENEQNVKQHNIKDYCLDPDQLKQLTTPSANEIWSGVIDLTTQNGESLKVQATSTLAETHIGRNAQTILIITTSLLQNQ